MKMQSVWVNKNVSPKLLSEHTESFLKAKGFATNKRENDEQYRIIAAGRHKDGSYVKIYATIFRKKDKLIIELSAGEQGLLSKMNNLTSFFGGGYITLQRMKSEEILDKLESEFFNYVDEVVLNLAGAVDSTKKN